MNEDQPWIAHGSETAEHEDFLIGNRQGLEELKIAVEVALRDGESFFQQPGIEYNGIRLVEQDPRKVDAPSNDFRGKLFGAGCLLLLIFCVFVFFVGLRALPALFN